MMSEMDEVKEFMNRFNRDFETKFGMAEDPELGQSVKITLLATGFGIQDIHMKEMDERITQRTAEEQNALPNWKRKKNRDAHAAKHTTERMPMPSTNVCAAGIFIFSTPKIWTILTSSAW